MNSQEHVNPPANSDSPGANAPGENKKPWYNQSVSELMGMSEETRKKCFNFCIALSVISGTLPLFLRMAGCSSDHSSADNQLQRKTPGTKIFFDQHAGAHKNIVVHSAQDLHMYQADAYYIEGRDTVVRFHTQDLKNGYEFSIPKADLKTPNNITDDRLVIDFADENVGDVMQKYPLPSEEELAAIDPQLPVLIMLSSKSDGQEKYSDALARKIYGTQQVVHLQNFNMSQFSALGKQLKRCKNLQDAEYHFAFMPAHHGAIYTNSENAEDYASWFKDSNFLTPEDKVIPAKHEFNMTDQQLKDIVQNQYPGRYTHSRMLFMACNNDLKNFKTAQGEPALLLAPAPAKTYGFGSNAPGKAEKEMARAAGLDLDTYTEHDLIQTGLSALTCLRNYEGLTRAREIMDNFSAVPELNRDYKQDVHQGWRIRVGNAELASRNAPPLVVLPGSPAQAQAQRSAHPDIPTFPKPAP